MRLRKVVEWITGVSLAELQPVVNDHGNAINQLLGQWGTDSRAAISGALNDYLVGPALTMRFDLSAPATISGLAGGADGQTRIIVNRTPGTALTLAHESVLSVAKNRIVTLTGANVIVGATAAILWYDAIAQRWIQIL